MAAVRPLRLAPEWDDRFTRMVGVSAVAHALALAGVIALAGRAGPRPIPIMAYTVEITDPSALGGQLPPGAPGRDLKGGPTAVAPSTAPPAAPARGAEEPPPPTAPEPKPEAPAEAKPTPAPEPPARPAEPEVRLPEKKPPEPKPAEPKPKPEAKKAAPSPEPAKKPEPAAVPKPPAKVTTPSAATPAAPKPPGARPAEAKPAPGVPSGDAAAPADAYAAAADRWRGRAGGGLGGQEGGSGPIGAGGPGPGGGGQLVGLEFLAYRQQVIDTIKARWTNVVGRPGLVAAVWFEIAPDGAVGDVRLQQSSGHAAYDTSALRAVQTASPLAPPPAKYQKEFREFVIEFHSEERGGGNAG